MSIDPKSLQESVPFSPMRWANDCLELLDQTRLPVVETWLECRTVDDVAAAIYRLSVRGAPAIGVSAAYGLVVGLDEGGLPSGTVDLRARFDATYDQLAATRPTAVNLVWALDVGRGVFEASIEAGHSPLEVRDRLLSWAKKLHADDIKINMQMGAHGARLFEAGDRVMTHCNAGALATGGYGTAVGVITSAWNEGRLGSVWVDETRPLLQGARLTSWELKKLGIPFHLVTDNSAGSLMSRGMVDRIVVGADRIAANGDAANKIGTYMVAAVAHRHGVPFYVAAPLSTIDRATATGADIPIEERNPDEVTRVFDVQVAPDAIEALNIAFDVTPNDLIAAIITEEGVLLPPFTESIAAAFAARAARSGTAE